MHKDLIEAYIPSCTDCQWNKNQTTKPAGPLHPLLVPDKCFDSVAINFIGPMPKDNGFNCIVTMMDRLGADVQITHGCPQELITNHNKLFIFQFWKALMKLSGIKHKMLTAFHPQINESSKRSNKMVIQALRFHVEQNQAGWAKALPKVCFNIMNTVNASTGYTPFMLKSTHLLCLILPLINLADPEEFHSIAPTSEDMYIHQC